MSGVFPDIGHFAQFFAESLASSGKVLEAVNIWKTWLDRLLEEGESHSFSEFTVEAIVIKLDKFFKTGDLAKAVEFWESSLEMYPSFDVYDVRRRALADTMLILAHQLTIPERLDLLKRAARVCPAHSSVSVELSPCFTIMRLKPHTFWNEVASIGYPLWSAWAHLKLAEHYSSTRQFIQLSPLLVSITEDLTYHSFSSVSNLYTGYEYRNFWREIVVKNPQWWSIALLRQAYGCSGFIHLEMWKQFVRWYPGNKHMSLAL